MEGGILCAPGHQEWTKHLERVKDSPVVDVREGHLRGNLALLFAGQSGEEKQLVGCFSEGEE